MRLFRAVAGTLGVAATAVGVRILLTDPHIHHPPRVAVWLVAALALHDGVLIPLLFGVGALLRPRGPARAGLVAAAALTAIALPVLLAPRHTNRTVLPLDYPRGLAIALAGVAAATLTTSAWTRWGPRRRARRTRRPARRRR